MTLAARYGQVHAQSTFIEAAVVAAHGAGGRADSVRGFRASDVRFFFLLFTNWIEHDVLRPEQDLDLTQVRRVLGRLLEQGWLERAGPKAGRRDRYALTEAGLLGLGESIVVPKTRRPLEEVLFVACFAATYRGPILARIRDDDAPLTPSARRRLADLLDPARVLRAAKRTWNDLVADLEQRIAGGAKLAAAAHEARESGATDAEIADRLQRTGAYQLQRVRPLAELMRSLPEDLLRLEIDEGIARRNAMLFEPLAERARAERAILEALETSLKP